MVRCGFGECPGEGSVLVWGNAQALAQPDVGWTGPQAVCEQHAAELIALGAVVRAEYPDERTFAP